ncbi:hypothetical protein FZC79_13060 [Rossellomorea vietnamensis]|uniref:Uncharacterized protein n=1 Tax=Rossellomorea vietnamensis TaxID=218284 RepID=A0A5D4KBS3_9BACI|nr:hypothetical protein FZC79_13060 [Rossellomorea vietnamensis]
MRFFCNPAPAPSPSWSNNPRRIKGKTAFYSPENICLSGLNRALSLYLNPARRSQRLADFGLSPCDKSSSTHFVRCDSFISYESPKICTPLSGAFPLFI